MPQIINMNELVGEDIVIQYGRPVVEYAIPGDVDVETVFELFEMYLALTKIEGDDVDQLRADVQRQFFLIRDKLMELLLQRQPNLEKFPFGVRGTGIILRAILGALNVKVADEDPTPPTLPKRTVPKTRSPRRR